MLVSLKKRTDGDIEFGIIYGGIAILVLCAAHFLPVLSLFPDCAFQSITGFPCPTCGFTRTVEHMAHGDLISSIIVNPLAALCFMSAVLYFVYSIFTLMCGSARIFIRLTDKEGNALRMSALFLVLLNWLYLINFL